MAENFGLEDRTDDARPLTDRERQLVNTVFSDPFSFPLEYKQWLRSFIESSDITLPRGSIHGPTTVISKTGIEWEDVGL